MIIQNTNKVHLLIILSITESCTTNYFNKNCSSSIVSCVTEIRHFQLVVLSENASFLTQNIIFIKKKK